MTTIPEYFNQYNIAALIIGSSGHDYKVNSNKQIVMSSNPYTIENAEVTLKNYTPNSKITFQYIRNHQIIEVIDGYEKETAMIVDGFLIVTIGIGLIYTFRDSGQRSTSTYIDSSKTIVHRYLTTINMVEFTLDETATDPTIDIKKKACSLTIGLMVIAFLMGCLQWVL